MSENATAELVAEAIDTKQPPGANADKIIEQAAAEMGPADEGVQMDLPGVPAPAAPTVPAGFDPDVHESANGQPVLNTDGTLRKIRGRKPQSPVRDRSGKFHKTAAPAPVAPLAPAVAPAAPAPEVSREAAAAAAAMYVKMGLSLAQGVFGDEWKPDNPAEEKSLVDAAAEYVFVSQFSGLSPGMVLLMTAGQFSFARVQRPGTLERLKHYYIAIRKWIIGR